MYRWILGLAGFFLFGRSFFGGFLGFIIGSLIDNNQETMSNARERARREGRAFSEDDIYSYYQSRSSSNDVQTMLMALSAAVMLADGKVLRSELDFVKAFFAQQFGRAFNRNSLQTLKQFLDSGNIPIKQICQDIRMRMPQEARVHLVHYLFAIAKSDGTVSESELNVVRDIANMLGVPQVEFESLKNMFYRDVDSDYKILGIEPTATDDEVKRAYRQMAIKFHPDKVATMGEEFQKGAKEKFQKIQEAYESIKKNRGFK